MVSKTLALAALAVGGLWAPAGFAQDIVIPNIIELSGGGATVGAMWKNGSTMAVDEINAAGGILGKKIKLEFVDTASDPGKARAAMQRALDDKPAHWKVFHLHNALNALPGDHATADMHLNEFDRHDLAKEYPELEADKVPTVEEIRSRFDMMAGGML